MRVTKKLTAALAAGTLAAALSACSGGEPAAQAEATDASVAEAGAEPAENLEELTTIIEAAQKTATSAHMEMTYGGEAAETAGMTGSTTTADFSIGESKKPADMTMQMSMSMMDMEFDMRMVDGIMYMNMGELSQGKFIEMPLEELKKEPGLASTLESMESWDVAAQADEMKDAVTSFEHTGSETVDGVDVEVYTMTVDPAKLKDGAAGVDAEMAKQVGEMTVVYKIDPEGLPLEADIAMDVQGKEMTMDTSFSKWGEPVTVEAPPKNEVVPYSEIKGG